jgi:regulator of sirC expression with transglutaminase-like and TPR domain
MPDPPLAARFASLLALPDAQIPLDEVSLVIAAHAQPGLDVEAELAVIDDIAAQVRDPTLTGLSRLLFRDLGFTGNSTDYYDPRNSFLNVVVERRTGIPISLSILMMEVGRRHRIPLAGVGMPGHFLLRDKVDPHVFIDPFDNGRLLDVAGCARIFRRVHGPGAQLQPSFLDPVERAVIVARVLGNLRGIYAQLATHSKDEADQALRWVLHLRTLVPGAGPAEHLELAGARANAGDLYGAASSYDHAADLLDASGADAAPARAASARVRARLN